MISARDLIWVLRFPLQEVSDWISLARPFHLDYGAVAEVSLYLAGGSCEASHSSIHPSAWKKSNSTKFAVARSSSRSPLGVALRGGSGWGYAAGSAQTGTTLAASVARNRGERAQVVAFQLPGNFRN